MPAHEDQASGASFVVIRRLELLENRPEPLGNRPEPRNSRLEPRRNKKRKAVAMGTPPVGSGTAKGPDSQVVSEISACPSADG